MAQIETECTAIAEPWINPNGGMIDNLWAGSAVTLLGGNGDDIGDKEPNHVVLPDGIWRLHDGSFHNPNLNCPHIYTMDKCPTVRSWFEPPIYFDPKTWQPGDKLTVTEIPTTPGQTLFYQWKKMNGLFKGDFFHAGAVATWKNFSHKDRNDWEERAAKGVDPHDLLWSNERHQMETAPFAIPSFVGRTTL